jgi:hypothetical protein
MMPEHRAPCRPRPMPRTEGRDVDQQRHRSRPFRTSGRFCPFSLPEMEVAKARRSQKAKHATVWRCACGAAPKRPNPKSLIKPYTQYTAHTTHHHTAHTTALGRPRLKRRERRRHTRPAASRAFYLGEPPRATHTRYERGRDAPSDAPATLRRWMRARCDVLTSGRISSRSSQQQRQQPQQPAALTSTVPVSRVLGRAHDARGVGGLPHAVVRRAVARARRGGRVRLARARAAGLAGGAARGVVVAARARRPRAGRGWRGRAAPADARARRAQQLCDVGILRAAAATAATTTTTTITLGQHTPSPIASRRVASSQLKAG